MNFNFTGSSRPARTINLGRQAGPSSAADVTSAARAQRLERQKQKQRVQAATQIQAMYRRYEAAHATRQTCQAAFDQGMLHGNTWSDWTRYLLFAFDTRTPNANTQRLARWAAAYLTLPDGNDALPRSMIRLVCTRIVSALQQSHTDTFNDTSVLLRFLAHMLNTSSEADQRAELMRLVRHGLYRALRSLLFVLPKQAAEEHAQCIAMALSPFTLFPATQCALVEDESRQDADPRAACMRACTRDILTIPQLLHRIPISSVTALATSLPLSEIMAHVRALGAYIDHTTGESALDANPLLVPDLLVNVHRLTSSRVKNMQRGAEVTPYLEMLTTLLHALPRSTWHSDHDTTDVSEKTRQYLDDLVSDVHVHPLLVASSKFATTTRPAFCAFFLAVYQAAPVSRRESLVSMLLYGQDKAGQGAIQFGSMARELWRGWVRSSPLFRRMSMPTMRGPSSVVEIRNILTDSTDATDWPMFLVLALVYSRCLLTLGDDEFYPPRMTQGTDVPKNPLTLDELVTISGILRNLVFSLYWGDNMNALWQSDVPGTHMPFADVRDVSTRLLKQLHTRDSRRAFVPEGHWHMLSQQDLDSFIQAVVLEERNLSPPETEDEGPTHRPLLSDRTRAFISPRLDILNHIPFVIPFDIRVEIFRQFIRSDVDRLGISRDFFSRTQRHRATIRREHIAEDGMAQLNALGPHLKEPLEIAFIDQWGMQEAGIDGGGVFKEFLTSMVRTVFDTDRGLWCANERQELYPNPHSYARAEEQLMWYVFLGRILGKALYEGILVDVKFAGFFLSKWLGQQGYVDDVASLESLDSELYRGLITLKNYSGDVENDFALNFTVVNEEFGVRETVPLISNGAEIPVTRENRLSYIYHMTRYRLSTQIEPQCRAFFHGLSELIEPRWLRLFNREELRVLVCGTEDPIDVDDLQQNTVYGGYHEKDMAIQYFWEALRSLDQPSRKAFLRFVTSSPNPPLLGFSELHPKFAIRHAGDDVTRLPTASTCVNLLKLPAYESTQQCLEKLRYAIDAGAGFDLS